jgi:hypothetical protein
MLQVVDSVADVASAAAIPGIKTAASLALAITNAAKVRFNVCVYDSWWLHYLGLNAEGQKGQNKR